MRAGARRRDSHILVDREGRTDRPHEGESRGIDSDSTGLLYNEGDGNDLWTTCDGLSRAVRSGDGYRAGICIGCQRRQQCCGHG